MAHFESPSSETPHRLRVLVVDDMPQVRRELCQLLALAGELDVVGEAADGLEAVHQVERLHPEAVVLDLEMPVMDGYEAAHRIKNRWPVCRVVVLSIHVGEAERQKAALAGADAFLVKGAPIKDLVKAIFERRRTN